MVDLPITAAGTMADFLAAGIISTVDFHTAERLAWHAGEHDSELPRLALALTMRALRQGSVCLDMDTAHTLGSETENPEGVDLAWPSSAELLAALRSSPLVTVGTGPGQGRPLRLVGTVTYLERYWAAEREVEALLTNRSAPPLTPRRWKAMGLNPAQQRAVTAVGDHPVTVITGGPGTGKTRTAAGIVAAYPDCRIALAAPTGKAAARLQESVAAELAPLGMTSPEGTTLHRLVGLHPSRPHMPRHHRDRPVPFDLILIDETSMVSLTMMSQLLAALRPDAHLVLIGDRDQLASVDAGAVLADLVEATHLLSDGGKAVIELDQNYRFDGPIQTVASAIRDGDVDACLAAVDNAHQADSARLVKSDITDLAEPLELRTRMVEWGRRLRAAAEEGDTNAAIRELDSHRLLCAHREGPYGAQRWNQIVGDWLGSRRVRVGSWSPGDPLLLTQNSTPVAADQVWNGDSGVIVVTPHGNRAAIARSPEPLLVSPALLDGVVDLYAMTIHKSQGSQFDEVSIILPPIGSPLLTRELLYTAVTRARRSVTIYGTTDALVQAIQTRARRASGLARLSPGAPPQSS